MIYVDASRWGPLPPSYGQLSAGHAPATHHSLTFSSPPTDTTRQDTTARHNTRISPHLHNLTTTRTSSPSSKHLQDNTLLYGSLLNSTPLFSLVLGTCNFHAQPQPPPFPPKPSLLEFVSSQKNCCPTSATSPRPKTRNHASLGYTPPFFARREQRPVPRAKSSSPPPFLSSIISLSLPVFSHYFPSLPC